MNKLEKLVQNYERYASIRWDSTLAGPQRVWFNVYDKEDERRLRARLDEFEIATKKHQHGWLLCDLTDCFAQWMAAQEYKDSFFEDPENFEMARDQFHQHVASHVRECLQSAKADGNTVVALLGVGSLFGFHSVSALVKDIESDIRGRLLVFFPGTFENNNYFLLDANRGWNYLAVPITAYSETQ